MEQTKKIVPTDIIFDYLVDIFCGWFLDHEDPPWDKSVTGEEWWKYEGVPPVDGKALDPYLERMASTAQLMDDLEVLRWGIDYYLCHPEIDLTDADFAYCENFGWEDAEVREVLKYIRRRVWPEVEVNCEEVKDVELVHIPSDEWWNQRVGGWKKRHEEVEEDVKRGNLWWVKKLDPLDPPDSQ